VNKFIETNRRNYDAYLRGLDAIPGISLVRYDHSQRANYQYIVVEVEEQKTGITRDELIELLFAENVLARRYFFPGCHRMEPYRSYFLNAALALPETEKLCRRVMVLPNGTSVDERVIARICEIIQTSISNAPAVREQLAGSGADPKVMSA
jgi:dTDP-4-amino-4,6-dideoxygalactose transaminase